MASNMDSKNSTNQVDNVIYSISDHLNIKRVSVEQLQKCKGFESITDEEAQSVIESLYQLSLLTYQIIQL